MTTVAKTTVKQVMKKLFKECEHSAEIMVRVNDENGCINLPFSLKDIKQEVDSAGVKLVIIDLT